MNAPEYITFASIAKVYWCSYVKGQLQPSHPDITDGEIAQTGKSLIKIKVLLKLEQKLHSKGSKRYSKSKRKLLYQVSRCSKEQLLGLFPTKKAGHHEII